jgi:GT2 family glycosyltransferase
MLQTNGGLDGAGSLFTKTGFLYHVNNDDLASNRFGSARFSLKGACLLVRTKLFASVGGFDASYFAYFEESDLCWRLIAMGYEVEYVRDATVIHDSGRTTTAIFSSAHIDFLSFRNRITTIRKNGDTYLKLRVLPIHFACCLGIAFSFLLNKKPRNAIGILRALSWHLRRPFIFHLLKNRPTSPVSLKYIKTTTIPFSSSWAREMLRNYLVRW